MKKIFLFLAAIGLVAITVSFVPALSKLAKPTNVSKHLVTNEIPADVKAIFDKSCIGCHGDGGKHMAMSMVNFSTWDKYDQQKQAKKGKAICKMVTKGKMPPKSIRKSKPELVPTQEQIDLICRWSRSLGK